MTVKDLIEQLQKMPQDAIIMIPTELYMNPVTHVGEIEGVLFNREPGFNGQFEPKHFKDQYNHLDYVPETIKAVFISDKEENY